jgi:hypothetical protein
MDKKNNNKNNLNYIGITSCRYWVNDILLLRKIRRTSLESRDLQQITG